MQTASYELDQLSDLPHLAKSIIQFAGSSRIILFKGELGSGKTTLIKNICNFLNVNEEVTSPTFSLVNQYQNEAGEKIYHFDLYRLESLEEAIDIGFEEYLDSGDWCLIEWPEVAEELIDDDRLIIEIEAKGKQRIFKLSKQN
jgi:tRNA threonylcarbamoyladenosine biosynthesis protein TsaE